MPVAIIDASNRISESLHVASTDMLQVFGTIPVDHCTAIGMTRSNNDFGRAHKNLVHGRKSKSNKADNQSNSGNTVGYFHCISANAQKSLIRFVKKHAKHQRQYFDQYLTKQFELRQENEEVQRRKSLSDAKEAYIDAILILWLYNLPRFWRTVAQVVHEFEELRNETQRKVCQAVAFNALFGSWDRGGTSQVVRGTTPVYIKGAVGLDFRYGVSDQGGVRVEQGDAKGAAG